MSVAETDVGQAFEDSVGSRGLRDSPREELPASITGNGQHLAMSCRRGYSSTDA